MTHFIRIMISIAAAFAALLAPAHANPKDAITTPEIVAASTNLSCMNWRISGTCFWLDCGLTGCSVNVSVMVSHYSPSVVVSAYDKTGESPWTETRLLHGSVQLAAHKAQYAAQGVNMNRLMPSGKFVNNSNENPNREDTHFKNADVIGGPGNIATIAGGFGFPLFCPMTDVAPLAPYFLSGIDTLAWTTGTTELLYAATWIPGMREIGSRAITNPLGNTWGSLYPRHGFIRNPDDVKSGAVIAQRAADIVYKSAQPHLYVRVGALPGWPDGGMRVWEPGELRENDPDNSVWQMLVPLTESGCEEFGVDDRFDLASWSDGKFDKANYTFNLWRPYSCCSDEGIFLTRIDF